ncbi:MAG: sensor histidine kinase [Chloroflexota bacterium]
MTASDRPLRRASGRPTEYRPNGCQVPAIDAAQPEVRALAATVAWKEEFLTSVCHDVQQPLTVILAQTQVLQRQLARGETLPPEQLGTCLAYIMAATNRVRGMTQDLLDASVQQSGHTLGPLLLARAELVALAREAVREHELVSRRHQFHFQADVPTLEAIVDEARLHRVLANLLTNAVKYSPKGGAVNVSLTATHGPAVKSALLVVRDEGVGIPRDDLAHVFDRFHRGANAVGRFAGTGLGLASARELVELHGGSICVQSEEGKGSTFVVRLPLTPPAGPDCLVRSADNAWLGTWPNPDVARPVPNGP